MTTPYARHARSLFRPGTLALAAALLSACGGGDAADDAANEVAQGRRVEVVDAGQNIVDTWSRIVSSTIALAGAPRVTPEELRTQWAVDHATLHAAIYDAVVAITRTHEPFAVAPRSPAEGASVDVAVATAVHGVLKGLFPNRSAVYQAPYDALLAAVADGEAKTRGLAIGAEVATGILALRTNDGRATAVPPFTPGAAPGDYRGANPLAPWFRYIKPFSLKSAAQFRAEEPPRLQGRTYAEDFNETRDLGGVASAVRNPEQTAAAQAYAEGVTSFWPRNLRQFARSQPRLEDNARLMALLWVSVADAAVGCWDSKYHYLRWRPISAIHLADSDGNQRTAADPAWAESVAPIPEHPEYPAAPGCVAGAVGHTLAGFYKTKKLVFSFDSTVGGGSVRRFESINGMLAEAQMARIWGGVHFRTSLERGSELGAKTARWVQQHHFRP